MHANTWANIEPLVTIQLRFAMANKVTGNEAEEFIKKIAIKIVITTAILIIGVGIAVYYTSGHG